MDAKSFWGVSAAAVLSGAVLTSCGGGLGEIVAAVAFIGSAGGDWRVDGNSAQAGLQQRLDCAAAVPPPPTEPCFINISIPGGAENLYDTAFDVVYAGNVGNCPASSTAGGRVDGKRINLPDCFVGEYVTINEALSDDGQIRAFFEAEVVLAQGVWVEIQDERRQFQFTSDVNGNGGTTQSSAGCELSAASRPAVDVVVNKADFDNPAGPFETTIASFTIAGDSGGAWSGRFVGVSGMSLRRGNQELELERRDLTPADDCPP
jgi:hypothetical protein